MKLTTALRLLPAALGVAIVAGGVISTPAHASTWQYWSTSATNMGCHAEGQWIKATHGVIDYQCISQGDRPFNVYYLYALTP
ncbi:hypothetical protein [Nonomuraea insulae]|uniref:Secreted protein n=1 Tax=Nonomuraea insulae TaxID=1616787 RepID=A0ABW1CSN6_9ACTN